jgi:hypothetical protein
MIQQYTLLMVLDELPSHDMHGIVLARLELARPKSALG